MIYFLLSFYVVGIESLNAAFLAWNVNSILLETKAFFSMMDLDLLLRVQHLLSSITLVFIFIVVHG